MSDGMWDLTAILRKQYLPKSWHRMIYWERKRYNFRVEIEMREV